MNARKRSSAELELELEAARKEIDSLRAQLARSASFEAGPPGAPTPHGAPDDPADLRAVGDQRRLFELLVRSIRDYGIYLLDPQGRVTSWNEGAQALKGYREDEILGCSFSQFFPPADAAAGKPAALLARALAEGHVEDEGWRVRKDGSRFWVDAVITPLYEAGELVGYAKVTRDLTERRLADEALRRANEQLTTQAGELQAANEELTAQSEELQAANEELTSQAEELQAQQEELSAQATELVRQQRFLQALVASVPVALAFLDGDLTYQWVNPAWAAATGKAEDDVAGRGVGEVMPEAAEVHDRLRAVAASGVMQRFSGIPLVPGRPGAWDVTYVPVTVRDESAPGLLVVAIDVSDRVDKERLQGEHIATLEQTEKLKDQFLSILSHELRTPINAIMGFGSILGDELEGPLTEGQRHSVGKILAGADTLLALVDDLLDMSRIQAGKFALDPLNFYFQDVVEEVVENLRPLAEQKQQTLVNLVPVDLPDFVADGRRIGQVMVNLIGNAIKFTPTGGTITVTARIDHGSLRCEVSDTGPGITADGQARLFKPFAQLDTSYTRQAGGTGLGLSIAKALVEAHSGRIGVITRPREGARFWFTLPMGLREGGTR